MAQEINYSGLKQVHYAPFEVVTHNKPDDCWLSFLGKVLDITPLIQTNLQEPTVKPLLAFAGKDISEWFDEKTGDLVYHIHFVTGCRVPYIPHGRFIDVDVQVPAEKWRPLDRLPWWKDTSYQVGLLTKRVRPIRILTPNFGTEVYLNVCCEDTILRIKERYSIFNSDCNDYLWKYKTKVLVDEKTLEENGIIDERDYLGSIGMDPNFYVPAIFIYYYNNLKWFRTDESSDSDSSDVENDENNVCCSLPKKKVEVIRKAM